MCSPGFAFSPDPTIEAIGFGLAIGVLIDAFVIRKLLVPAVMGLLGDAAWWLPARLERLLPHADIEGTGMRTQDRPSPRVPVVEPERESSVSLH